ncbi:MAG: hypothetical protein KBG15_12600, partial [Kofleriaceae bacterium]|nr:hypothetical protein [Kofleriaceae bacterium]
MLLVAGPARADGPSPMSQLPDEQVNVPAVPAPSCQCEDGGPWVPCTQCGGGGGTSSGDPANRRQGTPPIVKLAVGIVAGAAVAALFAVAPGNTTALFTKTQSAREAREAWHDERERLAALELQAKRSTLLVRDLNVSLRVAARPVRERVGAGYAPVAQASPPPDRWSANGACGQVLVANERLLERSGQRATEMARSQFPTVAGLIEAATAKVKQDALAAIAKATKTQKLLKQGQA